MIAIPIKNIPLFMKKLLLQSDFDHFLVSEAEVVTFAAFSIDGRLRPDYYSPEKAQDLRSRMCRQVPWSEIRPFCLSLIRGQRQPLSLRVIFAAPREEFLRLLEECGSAAAPEDIYGLYMNVQYKNDTVSRNDSLTVTTGTSLKVFSPDRSLDGAWDAAVLDFLENAELYQRA